MMKTPDKRKYSFMRFFGKKTRKMAKLRCPQHTSNPRPCLLFRCSLPLQYTVYRARSGSLFRNLVTFFSYSRHFFNKGKVSEYLAKIMNVSTFPEVFRNSAVLSEDLKKLSKSSTPATFTRTRTIVKPQTLHG